MQGYIPEKLIRGVTGHRSSALQIYERPMNEQLQETSGVLMHGKIQFCPPYIIFDSKGVIES